MLERFENNIENIDIMNKERFEKVLMELDEPIGVENLSEDEVSTRQNVEITAVKEGKEQLDTAQEKGNYGEMVTDVDMRNRGYERISGDTVLDINQSGHQGIDGVYYKNDGEPKYVIVETKYGNSQLSDTIDGKQMSENWIENRIDESVGRETANDIRTQKLLNPNNVETVVARVENPYNVSYEKVDNDGNIIKEGVKFIEI